MKGKVAIVTGSTSGIGLSIANTLAALGCNIVLNGFADESTVNTIKTSLSDKYKVKSIYSGADMRFADQIKAMITEAVNNLGRVDILVNNAGIQYVAPIEQFPDDKWNDIIATNLSASFHAIKAVLPNMKKNGWGRIINIASAHGLVASKDKSGYVAAKHGIIGLTKVVALEMAESHITCNAVCPGWVLTPLVEKQIKDKANAKNETFETASKELLSEKQPSLRFVKDSDIGELVAFLCSEAADSITGTHISIDGGWTAQ